MYDYQLKPGVPVPFKMAGSTYDAEVRFQFGFTSKRFLQLTLNSNTETLTGFHSTYTIRRGNTCYRGNTMVKIKILT